MKAKEIKKGGQYLAKVSGKLVTVRVDEIREGCGIKGDQTHYSVTNLSTGRKTWFRSAQKFHGPAKQTIPGVPTWVFEVPDNETLSTAAYEREVTRIATRQKIMAEKVVKPLIEKLVEEGILPKPVSIKVEYPSMSEVATVPADPTAILVPGDRDGGASREDKRSSDPTLASSDGSPSSEKPNGKPPSVASTTTRLGDRLRGLVPQLSKPMLKPTEEQQAITEAFRGLLTRGSGTLIAEAGAGTGKTSLLKIIAETFNRFAQYTAFNTSLVAESKEKFRATKVACNTTHSLAFRAVGKNYAHRLEGHRVRAWQVAKMLGIEDLELTVGKNEDKTPITKRLSAGFLASLVTGAVKRFCQSADPEVGEDHFRYIDGIDMPTADGRRTYANNTRLKGHLLTFAKKAWKDLSNPQGSLPFSHDCYVKIWQLGSPVIAGDFVLIDESQDLAPVMLDVLQQQAVPILLVGDSAQQVYEWRGAINAMLAFPEAQRLYLTQSFRFGPAIAEVANAVLSTLDETTPLRLKGLPSIKSEVKPVSDPRCILCRTNAGAVGNLLAGIAEGKKPYLVGGTSEVKAFVEASLELQAGKPTSHPDLACFTSWGEVQEYTKQDEGDDLKLLVKLIDTFGARVILDALKQMPAKEEDADLVISTAHKSKGRQWKTVQLGSDYPTESKCGDPERKLLYVAVTRAQEVLDVSECPFFTGRDSLDITGIAERVRECAALAPSAVPPAPASPPPPTAFTWSKTREGDWGVRGPAGQTGKVVEVVRKDGSKAQRRLGRVLWDGGNVSLYEV